MLASRLRGLSKFQPSNATLGLSTVELDNIIDTVSCLQLVAHHILIISGSELRQSMAFSNWLRQEIENQASDTNAAEAPDKETNVDYVNVLGYIEGAMTRSRLMRFLDLESQISPGAQWDLKAEGGSLFELYERELRTSSGQDTPSKQLPRLEALIEYLDTQCASVFSSIAETQRRNVRFGVPISLAAGVPTCMDMRMVIEVSSQKKRMRDS